MGKKRIKAADEAFLSLPEKLQEFLTKVRQEEAAAEDFVRALMVGNCPRCNSERTRDCYESPLEDPTIGICLSCYALFCLECGQIFEKGETCCDHWGICDLCEYGNHLQSREEDCDISPVECSHIKDSRKK
jgi:hypothetical protein